MEVFHRIELVADEEDEDVNVNSVVVVEQEEY